MKKFLLLLFVILYGASLNNIAAQANVEAESAIKDGKSDTVKIKPALIFSGASSLNFTQTSFSNWAAGGANSIAGVAMTNFKFIYKATEFTWETTLDMAYGLTYQKEDFMKNNDKLEFMTKFGLKSSKKWFYSLAVQLKTQFDKGYKSYPPPDRNKYTSRFMAPGYFISSLGMDYKPNENLSFMLSPFSAKCTFVLDTILSNRGDYGVTPGRKSLSEIGSLIKATYSKTFKSKSTINSTVELFTSWINNFGNIDVSWEFDWNIKINKWFSSRIYTKLLYDDDIKIKDADTGEMLGPYLQFKQMLGLGISLSF
jgi:hypothetical protein